MTDFRAIILRRLEHLGRSRYWLAEEVQRHGDEPSRSTIYRYLQGRQEMTAGNVARLLDALELEVVPGEIARAGKRRV